MVDVLLAPLRTASEMWRNGRRAEALPLFEDAIRQEPDNVRSYVLAARAYAEMYDFVQMEDVFAKLLRRAPKHPGVHHYIGETYAEFRLPDRAIASYERASRLPGAGPRTWMELASLYERAHRLEEAAELIDRTLAAGGQAPLAMLVAGRIQRRRGRVDEAEATFRRLIERLPPDAELASVSWGELALIKDEQGQWKQAIEAIERCKRIQRAQGGPSLQLAEVVQQRLSALIAGLTRDDVRRWRDEAADLPPRRTALLTGFPRSGTTLLEQVLDAHPDCVSSEERDFIGKELFIALMGNRPEASMLERLNDLPGARIAAERDRYFQAMEFLLGEPVAGRVHIDKNPAYNQTIPQVLRFFPETRLVVAIRDPRDVILSCYLRWLPLNAVSAQFLDVERAARQYALDMGAWLRLRELIEEPWVEIRYEDVVTDLPGQAQRALSTLGLPWSDDVLGYRERLLSSTKQVTSPTYDAVAQPVYAKAVGRWRNYEDLLEPALKTLEPFVREFGYR